MTIQNGNITITISTEEIEQLVAAHPDAFEIIYFLSMGHFATFPLKEPI